MLRVRLGPWSLEPYGIGWFMLVLVLQFAPGATSPEGRGRFRFYMFVLAILGVAGVFWGLRETAFRWDHIGWHFRIAIACVAGIFTIAAFSPYASMRAILRHLGPDAWSVARRAPAWIAAILFVGIVTAKPDASALRTPGVPSGAAFERWYTTQTRTAMPAISASAGARVTLIKFNDYQCPPCNRAHTTYKPIIDRLTQEHGGAFHMVSLDYPLERECNPYINRDVHPAACEAAVAVRLAREHGRGEALEEWFWKNQLSLTREGVVQAAREIGGVEDMDARYEATLALVRADIEIAKGLGVRATPTYFLNGVRLPWMPPEDLATAIRYELRTTDEKTPTQTP